MRAWAAGLWLTGVMGAGSFMWAQVAMPPAQPTPKVALLVLAKKDRTLSVVDPGTLQVVAKVPVGVNPHEVIASEDGRTAWVTNYDNGAAHTITVVDLVGQKVEKMIDLGPLYGPHGLAISGGKTYFTAERAKVLGRLDPAKEVVDWELGTGQTGTHMLWVSKDGRKIVTVNVGSGTLSLMEQKTPQPTDFYPQKMSKQGGVATEPNGGPGLPDWEETVVKVGGDPEGFDVLADEAGDPQTVWVANAVEGTVSIVDWKSRAVAGTIQANLPTANRLRFTPDRRLAVISREKSGEVAVLDVAGRRVLRQIRVGTGAAGVLVEPDGERAYVSCSPDNWVAVLDLKKMDVVGRILPGIEPDGLAWAVQK